MWSERTENEMKEEKDEIDGNRKITQAVVVGSVLQLLGDIDKRTRTRIWLIPFSNFPTTTAKYKKKRSF